MIKDVKILFEDPAIIEVEFTPIKQKIVDAVYKEENFEQLSFENLSVYAGRLRIKHELKKNNKHFKIIQNHFKSTFKEITKILLDIDPIRYPIFSDFETWWETNQCEKYDSIMPVIDKKGFSQPYHLDNRFSMWAGSINIADNDTTTVFSKEHYWLDEGHDSESRYYKASGKQWSGTFWLNTENNWHGVPLVRQDRYAIVCNQVLAK